MSLVEKKSLLRFPAWRPRQDRQPRWAPNNPCEPGWSLSDCRAATPPMRDTGHLLSNSVAKTRLDTRRAAPWRRGEGAHRDHYCYEERFRLCRRQAHREYWIARTVPRPAAML